MALNPFLHPRNPYKVKPNFRSLYLTDERFRAVSTMKGEGGDVTIDFKDRDAVRVLTETLLRLDFGLNVNIPAGSLVPTLPLRFNYLLWIEDMLIANDLAHLKESGDGEGGCSGPPKEIVGFDVGAGASAIYPILGAARQGWKMMASEVDATNFHWAQENVSRNNLQQSITIFKAKDTDNLFADAFQRCPNGFSFTMCNPPFYDREHSKQDQHDLAECSEADEVTASGEVPPSSLHSKSPEHSVMPPEEDPRMEEDTSSPAGKATEMETCGGEFAFISRMIQESFEFRTKARIFTCMCGHKVTVKKLKKVLHDLQKNSEDYICFAFTELCQGRTMRWAVAWSFHENIILADPNNLFKMKQERKRLLQPFLFKLAVDRSRTCEDMHGTVIRWLQEIDITTKEGKVGDDRCTFSFKAYKASWTGLRRKRREQERNTIS